MIVKMPPSTPDTRRLLEYVRGDGEPERRLLLTNLGGHGPATWSAQIEAVASLRKRRLAKHGKHIILAFAPGERLADGELREIVELFLSRMGYDRSPFAAFLHTDTPHPHIHIVTTPTTFTGEVVNQSWDWPRAERVAREVERRWKLRSVPSSAEARRRRKTTPELKLGERTGAASHREQFQLEIAQAGFEARTFPEFLRALEVRGYRTWLLLDSELALRGISFGKDGARFRGSQLGRDYKAGEILEAFGLDYDPTAHSRELFGLAVNLRPQENAMEPTATPTALERGPAAVAPPAKQTPLPLPDTGYDVAVVPASIYRNDPHRLQYDTLEARKGWDLDNLRTSAGWLERMNQDHVVLVRPEASDQFAFRDVSAEQLAGLKGRGLEPSWVVQAGDRYDVLLKTHRELSPAERSDLRESIARELGLKVPQGVYQDAIRMSGMEASPDLPRGKAELVELREQPFSASKQWLERAEVRGQAAEAAKTLDLPAEVDRLPAASLRQGKVERPEFPADSALASIQQRIDVQIRFPEPGKTRPLSDRSVDNLLDATYQLNRRIVSDALSGNVARLGTGPEVGMLVEAHRELAIRSGEAVKLLRGAEERLESAHFRLDQEQAKVKPGDDPMKSETYARALADYTQATGRYRGLERNALELARAEQRFDNYRLAFAAYEARGNRPTLEALDQGLRRELDLARRLGLEMPDERAAKLPVGSYRNDLRERGTERDSFWEGKDVRRVSELLGTRRALLHADALEQRAEQAPLPVPAGKAEGRQVAQFLDQRRAADLPGSESLKQEAAQGRLAQLAGKVAEGDLSAQTLRRLNGAIVAHAETDKLSLAVARLPEGSAQLLKRAEKLEGEIRGLAATVASDPRAAPDGTYSQLLSKSAEALAIHGRLEGQYRQLLGIADPGQPPRGVSLTAWTTAFLQSAEKKGLSVDAALGQLANASRVPIEAPMAITGRAVSLAYFAAQRVAHTVTQDMKQALRQ